MAVRRQDPAGPAQDAAVPLAEGPRGCPGEGTGDVPGRVPIAVRDVSHVHRCLQEERPGYGREVPGPYRDPRPGPHDRRAAARVQAQGSARSDDLHHLPGHSRFLRRRPARGAGAPGGPDHRRAAGHGPRKGQWLFNRATVRSMDRLYNAFESRAHPPRTGRGGPVGQSGPGSGSSPGCGCGTACPAGCGSGSNSRVTCRSPSISSSGDRLLAPGLARSTGSSRVSRRSAQGLFHGRGIATDDGEIAVVGASHRLARRGLDAHQGGDAARPADGARGASWPSSSRLFWLAVALSAYQMIDSAPEAGRRPAGHPAGCDVPRRDGVPGDVAGPQDPGGRAGLAAVLELFDFDVGTVLAGLGIGGLAVALAAQDTLKNFFGSLMLIADRTFRVGDLVKIGANEGVVESVGLRTTRIRGLDDSLLTIPNSDLTTAHVTNFGARRYRRSGPSSPSLMATSADALIRFRDGMLELIRNQAQVRQEKYEVAVSDLGSRDRDPDPGLLRRARRPRRAGGSRRPDPRHPPAGRPAWPGTGPGHSSLLKKRVARRAALALVYGQA